MFNNKFQVSTKNIYLFMKTAIFRNRSHQTSYLQTFSYTFRARLSFFLGYLRNRYLGNFINVVLKLITPNIFMISNSIRISPFVWWSIRNQYLYHIIVIKFTYLCIFEVPFCYLVLWEDLYTEFALHLFITFWSNRYSGGAYTIARQNELSAAINLLLYFQYYSWIRCILTLYVIYITHLICVFM